MIAAAAEASGDPVPAPPIGRAREPALVVLLVAVTLGGFFVVWVHGVLRDLRAHGALVGMPSPALGASLALVPIAHLWVFSGLAHGVAAIEDQHGDVRTNPAVLLVLFAVPVLWPFAIWGAQDALNRHWERHRASPDGWGDGPRDL